MICNVCGKEIKDGSKFCPFCGSSQIQDVVTPNEESESKEQNTSSIPVQNEQNSKVTYLIEKIKNNKPVFFLACIALCLLGLGIYSSLNKSNKDNVTNETIVQGTSETMKATVTHYYDYDETVKEAISADSQQGKKVDINNIKNFKYGKTSDNLDNQKGIRIYTVNGVTYQDGIEVKIEDGFIGLLQINNNQIIRIRTSASTSGTVIGHLYEYCILGFYDTAAKNGYTWYKIDKNQDYWMADDGSWATIGEY